MIASSPCSDPVKNELTGAQKGPHLPLPVAVVKVAELFTASADQD